MSWRVPGRFERLDKQKGFQDTWRGFPKGMASVAAEAGVAAGAAVGFGLFNYNRLGLSQRESGSGCTDVRMMYRPLAKVVAIFAQANWIWNSDDPIQFCSRA